MAHSNVLVIISRDNVVKSTFFVKIENYHNSVHFKVNFRFLFQTIIFVESTIFLWFKLTLLLLGNNN